MYKVEVMNEAQTKAVSLDTLHNAMASIKADWKQRGLATYPVAALTAAERQFWGKTREHLVSSSKTNAASMETIEKALFVVDMEAGVDYDNREVAMNALHNNGRTKWCDKSFNLCVKEDGNPSIHVEHSWADAPVPLGMFFNHALPFAEAHFQDINPKPTLSKVTSLAWDLDETAKKAIRQAEHDVDAAIHDSDLQVQHAYGLGKTTWKRAKLSPDAAVQMAMQLAYYRLHGECVSTYETIGMPTWLHGRTEACRVLSSDSLAFVEGSLNGFLRSRRESDRVRAEELLRTACKSHLNYIVEGQKGKGIDRHLMALRVVGEGEEPDLFTDPAFAKSNAFKLSTSNNSYIPRPFGGMFGTVDPTGYGICYIATDDYTLLCGESKKSCEDTDTRLFCKHINDALKDIAEICAVPIAASKL